MIESTPRRSDGGSVGKHTERSRDLGEISSRNVGGRFVADSKLFIFRILRQFPVRGRRGTRE